MPVKNQLAIETIMSTINHSPTSVPFFNSSDYTLLEKIGEGGFGTVYKALQHSTQQVVAIKILLLNPEFDQEKRLRYIERFERETLISVKLKHPNIVNLIDKGQCHEKSLYAVFEFVDGRTLKETLALEGVLSPVETAEVMGQVLAALAHAHKVGIIHRDIKPANIMLSRHSGKLHAKILDFGISTLAHEARRLDFKTLTLTQETLGTPAYSAPEQLRGEPPTHKTDLYMWGLVFLECLTGQTVMGAASLAAIFHKQLSTTNVALPAIIAGHPIAGLLRRVLHKKVSERSGDTEALYQELTQYNLASIIDNAAQTQTHSLSYNSDNCEENTRVYPGSISNTVSRERKQISVLCVILSVKVISDYTRETDIVDSIYPEQKSLCVDIATRYGAQHAGTLGDTLLFYYGYPTVSDNDCRLSARTALEINSEIKKRNDIMRVSQGIQITVRAGLHTGLITTHSESLPEGDTPNCAIELARRATTGQILCSQLSQQRLHSHIDLEPWADQPLGVTETPSPVFMITGERHTEAFGFLRGNHENYRFFGRDKELADLQQLNKDAQNVHIYGEAGIGKSSLVFELRHHSQHYSPLVIQCLPEFQNNALYPILNLLRHQLREVVSAPEAIRQHLQTILTDSECQHTEQSLALICAWMDLPLPDISVIPSAPDEQKSLLFTALIILLKQQTDEAASQPLLLIVEDIHWADSMSLEFLNKLASSSDSLHKSAAIITTSRNKLPSEFHQSSFHTLVLKRLEQSAIENFIDFLFNHNAISPELKALIIERSDGIPLFIEELVTMLKKHQLIQHINGVIDFKNRDSLLEVPGSLRDSLQQKLDDLVHAKETAQLASTIGREFDHRLLVDTGFQTEDQLQYALSELQTADLIFVQRRVDGDHYIFKHALVRDAAYESMLPKDRENKHRLVAETLETISEHHQTQANILAMHWGEAKHYSNAVKWGQTAASQALKRSAGKEAIYHGEKTRDWIGQLPVDEQIQPRLDIYSLLTSAYMETKGWASAEVLHYSQASLDLLESNHRHDELVSHLWWKMLNAIVSGKRDGLDKLVMEMDRLTTSVTPINHAAIRCAQGFYHFTQGDRHAAETAFDDSLTHYCADEGVLHQSTYGFDISVFAKATLARVYADKNQPDQALELGLAAVNDAKAFSHIPSIGISLMYYGIIQQQLHQRTALKFTAWELVDISNKHDMPIYRLFGIMLLDWANNDTHLAEQHLAQLENYGSRHGLGHFQSFYADMLAEQKHFPQALQKINQCLALDNSINEPNYLPYLLFKKARITFFHPEHTIEQAISLFAEARAIAQQQGVTYITKEIALFTQQHLTNSQEYIDRSFKEHIL